MDKSVSFCTYFIELYKKHPALWRIKDESYTDRRLKEKGYKELTEFYKTVDENATIDLVKKKINNLRTAFRKELRKVEKSKLSGAPPDEIYTPTLWYYKLLLFTEDHEMGKREIDNYEDVSNENIQEFYECDVTTQDDLIEQFRLPPENSGNTSLHSFEIGNKYSERAKSIPVTSAGTTRNIENLKPKRKEEETILEKAWSAIATKEDEFDIVGANVAHKLRRMNEEQRLQAEHLINDILFYGLKKKLNDNSEFRVNSSSVQKPKRENSVSFVSEYVPENAVITNLPTSSSTTVRYTEYNLDT